jgi:uncharacterized RDD family membrane protein YckC
MEVWIGRDGERHGPYPETDIKDWLRDGKVSGSDLGWYEGLADWQPLSILFPGEAPAQSAAGTPPPFTAAPTALPPSTVASLEDYAGFWKRFAAYILDAIVLYIPNLLVGKLMGATAAQEAMTQALQSATGDLQASLAAYTTYYHAAMPYMLVQTLITWLYFAVCESSSWQGTVGKLALGIRVTDTTGARLSFGRASGRYFAKILSFMTLLIGYLMIAWTQRKQGLHDLIAGTLVLNGRAGQFKNAQVTPARKNDGSFSA